MITILDGILQFLLFLAFTVISIPLHEFGHFIALKVFRCKSKLKIKWLEIIELKNGAFDLQGHVYTDNGDSFDFPGGIAPIWKVTIFIILFSGGLISSAIMLLFVLFLPHSYKFLWSSPIYLVASFQMFYAICEAGEEYNKFYLSDSNYIITISKRSCQ